MIGRVGFDKDPERSWLVQSFSESDPKCTHELTSEIERSKVGKSGTHRYGNEWNLCIK